MCMDHSFKCSCGAQEVSITLKNEILPPETLLGIYCPKCSESVNFNPETMVRDNGWVLEYEMEVATLLAAGMPFEHKRNLSPELIFDEDYCSWRGVYPGDHTDSIKEREQILALAKVDPKRYLQEMRTWANTRMEKLRQQGWRKANDRVAV